MIFLSSGLETNIRSVLSPTLFISTRSVVKSRDKLNINIGANPENYETRENKYPSYRYSCSDVKTVTGWDVIILSSGEALEEPLKENGMIIVSGYPKGKKLGILTLQFDN